MSLIKLTIYKRNGKMLSQDMIFNTQDIITPIRQNSDNRLYFTVNVKRGGINPAQPVLPVDYEVLSTDIRLQTNEFILLTVTKRNGRKPIKNKVSVSSETMLFNTSFVSESFKLNTESGSMFSYAEGDTGTLVDYEVSETLDQIFVAANNFTGTIEYDGGLGTYTGFDTSRAVKYTQNGVDYYLPILA